MTDKESLNSQDQKSTMYPPSLASKLSPQSMTDQSQLNHAGKLPESTKNSLQNGSYYQNMTQKSRLILPTAVWILIVVGGLCFLSLLSSLNKTINTLDTLVELEQEKEKLREQSLPRIQLEPSSSVSPGAERLEMASRDGEPILNKWISMPSWTSLEPQRNRRPKVEKQTDTTTSDDDDDSIKSFVNDILQSITNSGFQQQDNFVPIASGRIVIASGSGTGDENSVDDPIFSRLSTGIINGLNNFEPTVSLNSDNKNTNDKVTGGITVRIEKIVNNNNINPPRFVDPVTSYKKQRSVNKGEDEDESVSFKMSSHDEEMSSLDKSIDSLMAKLMEPAGEADNAAQNGRHQSSVLMPFQSPTPAFYTHHVEQHTPPRHTFKNHRLSQMSPLIIPISEPTDASEQQVGMIDDNNNNNIVISSLFNRPQTSKFVIPLNFGELLEPRDHKFSSTRQPVHMSSPYEFTIPEQTQFISQDISDSDSYLGDLKDKLANSIAHKFLNKILKDKSDEGAQNEEKQDNDTEAKNGEATIVLINGDPLISDKKQSLSMNEDSTIDNNQVSKLFNIFFGPPPDSKLMLGSKLTGELSSQDKESTSKEMTQDSFQFGPSVEVIKKTNNKTTTTTRVIDQEDKGQKMTTNPSRLATDLMDGFFGATFSSSPQFSEEKKPVKVEAQLDPKKDRSQNSNIPSKSPKELMLCECIKVAFSNMTNFDPSRVNNSFSKNESLTNRTSAVEGGSYSDGSKLNGNLSIPLKPSGYLSVSTSNSIPFKVANGNTQSSYDNVPIRFASHQSDKSPNRQMSSDNFSQPLILLSTLNNST